VCSARCSIFNRRNEKAPQMVDSARILRNGSKQSTRASQEISCDENPIPCSSPSVDVKQSERTRAVPFSFQCRSIPSAGPRGTRKAFVVDVRIQLNQPDGWAERCFQDAAISAKRLLRIERTAGLVDGGTRSSASSVVVTSRTARNAPSSINCSIAWPPAPVAWKTRTS
jgi:hypothetical protein